MFTTGGTRLKVKADDIKNKAGTLKSTADSQSSTELATTNDTDIQDDSNKGSGLNDKSGELAAKAQVLSTAADQLESAAKNPPLATLSTPAQALKDAAKKTGSSQDGLYEAANQLATQNEELENKAGEVIQRFEEVQGAYITLSGQTAYKNVIEGKLTDLTQDQKQLVKAVTTEYKELETIYNGMLSFTKLIKKASTLNVTATGQTGTELTEALTTPATQLATLAQALSTKAGQVDDTALQQQAQKLREAASNSGSNDTSSLHKKASELAKSQDYDNNAKPVIIVFDTLKDELDKLIKLAIQNGKLTKVRDVKSKFKELKNHYDTMMPITKIKYYSGKIESESGTLRKGTGGNADNIVKYFESMNHAYIQLTDEDKTKVQTQFDAINAVYDLILNVNKMKQPADNLNNAAQNLSTVATAQLFKDKYDKFETVYDKADKNAKTNVTTPWNDLKNVITDAMKRWKFHWIIGPSILCQWLNFLTYVVLLFVYLMGNIMEQVYNKTQNTTKPHASNLKAAASGMLIDAGTLHGNATSLAGAAQGDSAESNEALKQKAGENERTPGTLRYLASELYTAASQLQEVAGSDDEGAASNLATEVGSSETASDNKLRHKLKELAGPQFGDLSKKAQDVRNQYGTVKAKFEAVEKLKSSAYTSYTSEYQAVVDAWNAFNSVYNANLKQLAKDLKEAIGDTSSGLQQALKNLNDADENEDDKIVEKATKVIEKYNDAKEAYDKVTAFETTYKAITATKTHYTEVETKFTELQKVYSNAIYQYKFHLITIPSMVTNWLNFLTFVILLFVFVIG